MRLVYYRKSVPNFGDDLNAALWPALMPGLFEEGAGDAAFVGIGTIIGMPLPGEGALHVFSSGAGYDRLENWQGRDVRWWCVRGPLSARLLGLAPEAALSDGAILTPLAPGFPRRASGGRETLVIPHFQTIAHPGWPEVAELGGFGLVDPRGEPAEIVARIAGAGLVLTESLHGAIIADTYGVPWMAFATSRNFGPTKWVDWRQSLGEDFSFTVVPPPDALHLLEFGRAPWPLGSVVTMYAEAAMAAFSDRVAPPPPPRRALRARLKEVAKSSWLARRLLGCSPARTAAALTRLAVTGAPAASSPALRAEIQARMMGRLHALAA